MEMPTHLRWELSVSFCASGETVKLDRVLKTVRGGERTWWGYLSIWQLPFPMFVMGSSFKCLQPHDTHTHTQTDSCGMWGVWKRGGNLISQLPGRPLPEREAWGFPSVHPGAWPPTYCCKSFFLSPVLSSWISFRLWHTHANTLSGCFLAATLLMEFEMRRQPVAEAEEVAVIPPPQGWINSPQVG